MTRWKIKPFDRKEAERILEGQPHHVQSTPQWMDFITRFSKECDRSVSVECDGEQVGFLCALQHRNLIQSLPFPASYGGLQTSRKLEPEDARALYRSLFAHYSRHCDVVSICTSPFVGSEAAITNCFDYQSTKDVHYIDLTAEPLANTTSKFRNNLHRNLQKAEKAHVEIAVSDNLKDLAEWYRCYDRRLRELGGVILPEEYFTQMFQGLQPRGSCSLISAKSQGNYLGGIITVQNTFCVDYYLSMFDREHDEMQASTASFHFLLSYARSFGAKILNLQSSPTSQTDLIRFKESWGALQGSHRYLTKIVNNRDKIQRMSEQEIKANYQYHFLLPFDALKRELSLA